MQPFYQNGLASIYQGDCVDVMASFDDNTFDTIITDPPYGLGFMGKKWDQLVEPTRDSAGGFLRNGKSGSNPYAAVRVRHGEDMDAMQAWHYRWAEAALRVAKPGASMLVMGGTRTHHRLMCAIEDAGWEIRDCLMWLYGSGFPKSHNIGKATADESWDGWGTALKPAYEPIILAMKPREGTFVNNALEYGVAGLWIDGGRTSTKENLNGGAYAKTGTERNDGWGMQRAGAGDYQQPPGRWPANIILDEEAAEMLDEQTGNSQSRRGNPRVSQKPGNGWGMMHTDAEYDDLGGASRFFYCAKASKSERTAGGTVENKHPTVKPIALMRYLCRLTKTPTGGTVLDPFMGSGTTLLAAIEEGREVVGIDSNMRYCLIAAGRLQERQCQST